jgi:hypothetical protein
VRFPAIVVLAAAGALIAGGTAMAGPAGAIADPRRASAEVTHGPGCGPGVVRVQVTNGTEPHRLALVVAGSGEQDAVDLVAAGQAELASADVGWGRTVSVSVTVTDLDGTAEDPIELGTYTRPSAADCAAVLRTTLGTGPAGSPPAAAVSPGGVVTLRAGGFTPGESVTVSMLGFAGPLTTVTAGADGRVEAVVQIPREAALGSATVRLVGGDSAAITGVGLRVAPREAPLPAQTASLPVGAAWMALIGVAAALGLTARPSRVHHHPAVPLSARPAHDDIGGRGHGFPHGPAAPPSAARGRPAPWHSAGRTRSGRRRPQRAGDLAADRAGARPDHPAGRFRAAPPARAVAHRL